LLAEQDYSFLFNLDAQLLFDTILLAVAIFFLFLIMSYLLFNPARKLLKDRQDRIENDINTAKDDKEAAAALKAEYEGKLKEIDKEAEAILSEARQKAVRNEAKIIDEAKEEASRIIKRAQEEAELEKKHAMDDMKQEMIQIASLMAQKVVCDSINAQIQDTLVDETIKEMGDSTWQS
jgi:F-type H+-transporting ATPase subunit b